MYSKLNAKQQAKTASSATRPDVSRIFANLYGTQSEVRCYQVGEPIFAALTREFPGPFALWDFIPADEQGMYTIKNIGLNAFVGIVKGTVLAVVRAGDAAKFRVQPAEDGYVQIKLPHEDKVWTLSGSGPRQDIVIDGANGSIEQKFTQVVVDE